MRRATLTGKAQPVLCGSSFKYVGVQRLLDAVADYLPCPLDKPAVVGRHPKKDTELVRKPDVAEPFCGLVFKLAADAHGDLAFVRVYSGKLKANTRAYNPGKDKKENISRLYHMHADPRDREAIDEALAGDIVGVVGLKEVVTGDTLCDASQPILLERIVFPETVISMSIEPVSSADKGKLSETLAALAREDPTFAYQVNEETGQTIISGMGELHLEILKNKMTRDFKLKVHIGKPRVSYRETIKRAVKKIQGTCIRQTGGSGMYAKVTIDLEPAPQPKGGPTLVIVNKLKGGVVPHEFIPAIEAGLREEAKSGGRTGYPLVDLKATIIDGDTHDVDSNEAAFRFAAADAMRKAVHDAGPVLLEPLMKLEVVAPRSISATSPPTSLPDAPRSPTRSIAASSASSRPASRLKPCSAIPAPSAASPKAAPIIRWNPSNTPPRRRNCWRQWDFKRTPPSSLPDRFSQPRRYLPPRAEDSKALFGRSIWRNDCVCTPRRKSPRGRAECRRRACEAARG